MIKNWEHPWAAFRQRPSMINFTLAGATHLNSHSDSFGNSKECIQHTDSAVRDRSGFPRALPLGPSRNGMSRATRFLFAAALAIVPAHMTACARAPRVPDAFGSETDADLKRRHGCVDVIPLQEASGTFKALVFKLPRASESDSDYRIQFYRKDRETFHRHGAQQNLVNFQRPVVVGGSEPRIETVNNRLGVRFHYRLTAADVELVPSEGTGPDGALKGHPPVPNGP